MHSVVSCRLYMRMSPCGNSKTAQPIDSNGLLKREMVHLLAPYTSPTNVAPMSLSSSIRDANH